MSKPNICPRSILAILAAMWSCIASASVEFSGLDEDLEKNARALMELANTPCDAAQWRVVRLYESSDIKLRDALEAMGYYRFSFKKSISFDDANCWHAVFDVEQGAPTIFRNVDVVVSGEALQDREFGTNTSGLQPVPNTTLNHGQYETYKKQLLVRLRGRGYFDVEMIDSGVKVDESLQFADVMIRIESGPRYHFGDITFSEGILRQSLLKAYLQFQKGDPFDATKISKLHELLSGSGYFSSVSIRAEPVPGDEHEVPVNILLTPAQRRVYTVGAGYATDTGVQGRLGYTNRRRNDRGHQFDSRLFLSGVDSELTGTYRLPRGRPDTEWVEMYGGFLQKRTDTSESDKTTMGIRVTRNRTERWLETPYVDVTYERFVVGDQRDSSRLIIPGIRWESTVGRDFSRLAHGHSIRLDVRGSHVGIGSDSSFGQITGSTKWIKTVGWSTRLTARANLGATLKSDIEELPATVRFFTGGDTSVRGYGFETIGPTDVDGNVIGGSNLVAVSLEADRLVWRNWAIAAFVDSGSAFNDTNIDFKTGIGLGIRWYSPLGPIRVDFAHPLDEPDRNFRLHITLGPDL